MTQATAFGMFAQNRRVKDNVMSKKKAVSFEESLAELEQLVKQMDSGELTLEESLIAFESGIGLIRNCQSALQTAEQKVQKLVEKNGHLEIEAFQNDE